MVFQYDGGTILAYNSRTKALVEFSDRDYEAYLQLASGENPEFIDHEDAKTLMDELTRGNFLIKNDLDEYTQSKALFNVARFLTQGVGLTIVVTHNCNLACSYCYEQRTTDTLSDSTIPAIVDLAQNLIRERRPKKFHAAWYGGEPLLKPDFIDILADKLEKLCAEKEVDEYTGSIVTNGTLLTRDNAEMLKKRKVKSAQITLDGPPEIHDKRRPFLNGKGTFRAIVENIKQSHDLIMIKVRVNVDINNVERAEEVLDELEAEGLAGKIYVYFAPVDAITEKCAKIENTIYSREEFSAMEVELLRKTIERGFHLNKSAVLPITSSAGCSAISPYSMVIDAKQQIQKCWIPLGNEEEAIFKLPKVANGEKIEDLTGLLPEKDNFSKWLAFDPFAYEKCRECNMLPTCNGGCPYYVTCLKLEPQCPTWKYNIKERLWLYRQCLEAEEKNKAAQQ
jgi:uncharacterized protein